MWQMVLLKYDEIRIRFKDLYDLIHSITVTFHVVQQGMAHLIQRLASVLGIKEIARFNQFTSAITAVCEENTVLNTAIISDKDR